jgi:hypothetical protein
MKALASILSFSLTLVICGLGMPGPVSAEIIGADDFSELDGTAVNGKAADVGGGNWSAPAAQTVVSGILDTDPVGQHEGSFLDLTRALGPGEVLTMTFQSAESAGLMFDINGYAGMSFYIGGSEKIFVGDPGGGQAVDGWALDGFAGGTIAYSGLSVEAVDGTFTYNYDTGVGKISVTDGVNTGMATHFYDPGLALDRFRIQSGSSDVAAIAIDSFSISAGQVPEPAALTLLATGIAAAVIRSRKRKLTEL